MRPAGRATWRCGGAWRGSSCARRCLSLPIHRPLSGIPGAILDPDGPPLLTLRALNRATLARQLLLERSRIDHPGRDRAPRGPPGPDAAHGVHRAMDSAAGFRPAGPVRPPRGAGGRAARPHARHHPPGHRARCVAVCGRWSSPSSIGPRKASSGGASRASTWTRWSRWAAPSSRGAAHVQGARRPPPHALAWPRSVRARTGRPRRRAARPGPASRPVGKSGPIAHTSIEAWLGDPPDESLTLESMVLRYLGAFGPASVMDAQAWCGLTKLGEVLERLRPDLDVFRDERGRELFDLPDAPRPDPDTPGPARASSTTSRTCSCRMRTGRARSLPT